MSTPRAQGLPTTGGATSFKTGAVLWAGGMFGVLCVLPYVVRLQRDTLQAAIEQTGLSLPMLLALSVAQAAVVLAVAIAIGAWASRRVGLGAPLLDALLQGGTLPPGTKRVLAQAVGLGVACGGGIIALELFVFVPLDPDGIGVLQERAGHPPVWQGLLASFYGGIAEELQLRLFLLSLLALGLRGVGRLAGANQRVLLPVWAFWGANVIAAVLFGLGHLPATAALIPITGVVVVRAVVLNGTAALAFGWLFRRNGIETAMVAHFVADVVLLVIAPLILVEGSLP